MERNTKPEEETATMGAGPQWAGSPESDPEGGIRVTPFFLGLLRI